MLKVLPLKTETKLNSANDRLSVSRKNRPDIEESQAVVLKSVKSKMTQRTIDKIITTRPVPA